MDPIIPGNNVEFEPRRDRAEAAEVTGPPEGIVLGPHSPLHCADCGTNNARTFVLVRRRGLYAALCLTEAGGGCYPRSGRVLCPWMSNTGMQCMNLVEYEITVGGQRLNLSCGEHLAQMIPQGADGVALFTID